MSHNAVAATLADGRVLVAGGERDTCGVDYCGETYVALEAASLYDPATDTWTALPPMPEPRAGGVAVTLADGSVLIVGGYNETMTSGGPTARRRISPPGSRARSGSSRGGRERDMHSTAPTSRVAG